MPICIGINVIPLPTVILHRIANGKSKVTEIVTVVTIFPRLLDYSDFLSEFCFRKLQGKSRNGLLFCTNVSQSSWKKFTMKFSIKARFLVRKKSFTHIVAKLLYFSLRLECKITMIIRLYNRSLFYIMSSTGVIFYDLYENSVFSICS